MMKGLTPQMQQKIVVWKEQLEKSEITRELLSDQMEQEIFKEIAKPAAEINNEWLNACAELMVYADQEQHAHWPDETEKIKEAIRQRLPKKQQTRNFWMDKRIVCAVACMVLLLAGISTSWSWFCSTQSDDEQVYTLTGQQVEIGIDTSATADSSQEWRECETKDFQEFCDFLGYTPSVPTWVPEGWKISSYYASVDSASQWLLVTYEKTDEQYLLTYDYRQAADISMISVDIYQDGIGEYLQIKDGLELYVTTNTSNPIAVWTTSNTYSSVAGPISVEELKELILSIQ